MPKVEETLAKKEKEELKKDDQKPQKTPTSSSKSKLVKKVEPKKEADDDDDDEVPLAVSKAKKKKPTTPASTSKAKKEEIDSEEPKPKITPIPKAKLNASKVKKEEPDDSDYSEDEKDKKKKKITPKKMKEVKKVKQEHAKEKEKKERKVYDLPGQKHDPPEDRDPLRIFYESLYQQVPSSEMAAFCAAKPRDIQARKRPHKMLYVASYETRRREYMRLHFFLAAVIYYVGRMMEWGLLPAGEAKKVYEMKLLKNQQGRLRSPAKVVSVKRTTNVSVKTVKKTTTKTVVKTTSKKRKADSDTDNDDDDFVLSKPKKRKFSA